MITFFRNILAAQRNARELRELRVRYATKSLLLDKALDRERLLTYSQSALLIKLRRTQEISKKRMARINQMKAKAK